MKRQKRDSSHRVGQAPVAICHGVLWVEHQRRSGNVDGLVKMAQVRVCGSHFA